MQIPLWQVIKKKEFSPLYVLFGEEGYLLQETKQLIIQHALSTDELDFNFSSFDLVDDNLNEAIAEMKLYPFLGERRVVVVNNAFFLTTMEKKLTKREQDLDELFSYIASPAEFTIAIFIAPVKKLDERKKICKQLRKQATFFEAKAFQENTLLDWLNSYTKVSAVNISKEVGQLLLSLTGNNLQKIKGEIDKLLLAVYPEQEISEQLVMSLVPKTLEHNVFMLVDKIINRKLSEASILLRELIRQKEEPLRILGAIVYQYRLLLLVKILSKKGYTVVEMAKELSVSTYPLQLARRRIDLFSVQELMAAIKLLADLDHKIKTTGQDPALLLDIFILQIKIG